MDLYHSNTDDTFHEMFMRRQISVTISTNGDKHHVLFNRKSAVGRFGECIVGRYRCKWIRV